MSRYCARLRLIEFVVCALAITCGGGTASGSGDPRPLPGVAEVEKALRQYFDKLAGYEPGDLLSRSQVEPLFGRLEDLGWTVADRREIVEGVLDDGDFLVKQLRTPAGRKFMRDVAKYSSAYDRLHRLGRLPHGKDTVKALVRGPDGYKMIEYMTTTPGGRNLGKQLSNAPKGKGFNKPTGRIYTAEQLLARLKQSHAAAIKASPKLQNRTK